MPQDLRDINYRHRGVARRIRSCLLPWSTTIVGAQASDVVERGVDDVRRRSRGSLVRARAVVGAWDVDEETPTRSSGE